MKVQKYYLKRHCNSSKQYKIKIKTRELWSEEDRKVQYNLKAKNIITSALGIDEYFRVSNCTIAKEMWDTLQLTHEGTTDFKRSRITTLTHEYELFRMKTYKICRKDSLT